MFQDAFEGFELIKRAVHKLYAKCTRFARILHVKIRETFWDNIPHKIKIYNIQSLIIVCHINFLLCNKNLACEMIGTQYILD